jgi:hypothetical protein
VLGGNTGFLVGVGVVPQVRGKRYGRVCVAKGPEYGPAHLVAFEPGVEVPSHPELVSHLRWHGCYKISELLIARTLDTLFDAGVQHVIGNARVPAFHQRPDMHISDYCRLRRPDGKLFDPVLRFHERMGAEVLKPVEYSMEDTESRNAGCWVIYRRRFAG